MKDQVPSILKSVPPGLPLDTSDSYFAIYGVDLIPGLQNVMTVYKTGNLDDYDEDRKFRKFYIMLLLSRSFPGEHSMLYDFKSSTGESHFLLEANYYEFSIGSDTATILKNEKNEMCAIASEISALGFKSALRTFEELYPQILDLLSYKLDRPVFVDRVSIFDIENQVTQWFFTYAPEDAVVPKEVIEVHYSDLVPLQSLYREALSNISPHYKFMCYFKIMEGVFGTKNRISKFCIENKISIVDWSSLRIPDNYEIRNNTAGYVEKKITWFFDHELKPKYRNYIAHFSEEDSTGEEISLIVTHPNTVRTINRLLPAMHFCSRILIDTLEEQLKIISVSAK